MRESAHFLFFGSLLSKARFVLPADESRHATAVLRAKVGDTIETTDGKGTIYTCTIGEIGSRGAVLSVIDSRNVPAPPRKVVCAIGLPEQNAFETALENIVPLGVSEIVPTICDSCQRDWWSGKWDRLTDDRFASKIKACLKQSRNPWVPVLDRPRTLTEALERCEGTALLADEEGIPPVEAGKALAGLAKVWCFIGPPGGFTGEEREVLRGRSVLPVSLSALRLRTELASVLLCWTSVTC